MGQGTVRVKDWGHAPEPVSSGITALFGIATGTTPQDAVRINFGLGIATIWADTFGPESDPLDSILLLIPLPGREWMLDFTSLASRSHCFNRQISPA
jgi:hypothetical protein